jgi:uncharacterized membrane protein
MKSKIRYIQYFALIFAILGLILSIIIILDHNNYSLKQESICFVMTGANGCEIVEQSEYSKILGIDNAIIGIYAFCLLIIITASLVLIKETKNKIQRQIHTILTYITILSGIIAASIATYFIYLQSKIINAYCIFCMITDILSIIFFLICIYWSYLLYTQHRKHK